MRSAMRTADPGAFPTRINADAKSCKCFAGCHSHISAQQNKIKPGAPDRLPHGRRVGLQRQHVVPPESTEMRPDLVQNPGTAMHILQHGKLGALLPQCGQHCEEGLGMAVSKQERLATTQRREWLARAAANIHVVSRKGGMLSVAHVCHDWRPWAIQTDVLPDLLLLLAAVDMAVRNAHCTQCKHRRLRATAVSGHLEL